MDALKCLFILGNGFDQNLGLKTSYKDFLKSANFLSLVDPKRVSSNPLAQHLQEKSEIDKWVDVELELENFFRMRAPKLEHMHHYYNEVKNALIEYLKGIDINSIDTASYAYNLFIEVLSKNKDKNREVCVMNFNYTRTAEAIYNDWYKSIKNQTLQNNTEDEFIYIHGNLEDNNIIFGLHQAANIGEAAFLIKSSSENFLSKDINKYISSFDEIIIFGHSLGSTDHDYFKSFFTECTSGLFQGKHINIYNKGTFGINSINHQLRNMNINIMGLKTRGNTFKIIDVER